VLGAGPAAKVGAPGTSVQIQKGTDVTSKVF
jgi:hypothetical protein